MISQKRLISRKQNLFQTLKSESSLVVKSLLVLLIISKCSRYRSIADLLSESLATPEFIIQKLSHRVYFKKVGVYCYFGDDICVLDFKDHCVKSVQIRTRNNSAFGHFSRSDTQNHFSHVCGFSIIWLIV